MRRVRDADDRAGQYKKAEAAAGAITHRTG
jgi:hypothetical protein